MGDPLVVSDEGAPGFWTAYVQSVKLHVICEHDDEHDERQDEERNE